jgi:signal transduction histidine kinase
MAKEANMEASQTELAVLLLECNIAMARASNELDALKAICDLLVHKGGFSGASVGFHQTGKHMGTAANHCFLLKAEGQQLGALVLSATDPEAFTPALVDQMTGWAESVAQLLAAVRRRALHGRAAAEMDSQLEDLKRTEAALRRSEAFLEKAQRLSLTGSFIWTISADSAEWSDETFRILGYDRATTPKLELLLQRVHPEEQPRMREIFSRATCAKEDFEAELRLLMPDGATKHVRLMLQAIGCPSTGEFVGAIMDVTATKEMAQAVAFRDQLMAILGHDLRNPLSAVLGVGELARLDGGLSPTLRGHFTQIERAASRMQEMIDTLLDFAQTRFAGRLPVSPVPTDLRDLCTRIVEELTAGNPHRKIDLEAQGDVRGYWDSARIGQVVSNLLGNALTHGDAEAPVRLSLDGEPTGVKLKVHNCGRPIDADQIPGLFEPFRRGRPADGRPSRGLGLGLHIVKQIVCAHGGTITVWSSAQEGTTFCVALPRSGGSAVFGMH